jgi:hypothetical protein
LTHTLFGFRLDIKSFTTNVPPIIYSEEADSLKHKPRLIPQERSFKFR